MESLTSSLLLAVVGVLLSSPLSAYGGPGGFLWHGELNKYTKGCLHGSYLFTPYGTKPLAISFHNVESACQHGGYKAPGPDQLACLHNMMKDNVVPSAKAFFIIRDLQPPIRALYRDGNSIGISSRAMIHTLTVVCAKQNHPRVDYKHTLTTHHLTRTAFKVETRYSQYAASAAQVKLTMEYEMISCYASTCRCSNGPNCRAKGTIMTKRDFFPGSRVVQTTFFGMLSGATYRVRVTSRTPNGVEGNAEVTIKLPDYYGYHHPMMKYMKWSYGVKHVQSQRHVLSVRVDPTQHGLSMIKTKPHLVNNRVLAVSYSLVKSNNGVLRCSPGVGCDMFGSKVVPFPSGATPNVDIGNLYPDAQYDVLIHVVSHYGWLGTVVGYYDTAK